MMGDIMNNESNILNEIDSIIDFMTAYPYPDKKAQQKEESAAEPTFTKMDENVLVLEW